MRLSEYVNNSVKRALPSPCGLKGDSKMRRKRYFE